MSTPIVVLIVVFAVTAGIALGIAIDYLGPVKKEKKEEAKRRSEVLRKAWSFLSNYFYEPLVFEVAKEVAETGFLYGPNYTKWGEALRVLEELGFTKDSRVRGCMFTIHSAKATKFMINIGWAEGTDRPYIGTRTWSTLYLDEKGEQIDRRSSSCRSETLEQHPFLSLNKSTKILVQDPNGNLTDSLDVKENSDEILVLNSDEEVVYRYIKPPPVFSSDP